MGIGFEKGRWHSLAIGRDNIARNFNSLASSNAGAPRFPRPWRERYNRCPVKVIGLRHASALGLLAAWYLLTPPFAPGDPPGPLQLRAPLSQWNQMDSSDTASGCDEQRNNMVRMYSSADMTSAATQFKLWLYHNSVCVSSADPRLKQPGKQLTHQPLK
jgi:hypothetical protein